MTLERELTAAKSRIEELDKMYQQLEHRQGGLDWQIASITASNAALTKERDAYQSGCESAKRSENEWHNKWDLNQTEKINLRNQLFTALETIEKLKGFAIHCRHCALITANEFSNIQCTCGLSALLQPDEERKI